MDTMNLNRFNDIAADILCCVLLVAGITVIIGGTIALFAVLIMWFSGAL